MHLEAHLHTHDGGEPRELVEGMRLLRAAADHDVDMAMLERAMVLVERDGIDGAVALQQVRQPLAIGP